MPIPFATSVVFVSSIIRTIKTRVAESMLSENVRLAVLYDAERVYRSSCKPNMTWMNLITNFLSARPAVGQSRVHFTADAVDTVYLYVRNSSQSPHVEEHVAGGIPSNRVYACL